MLKKLIHAMLGLTLAVGIAAASVKPAEAGRRGSFAAGVAVGAIGLGLLSAAAHARGPHYYRSCYEGPRRCEWRGRHCFENYRGDWVCRGGHYSCWRPEVCD